MENVLNATQPITTASSKKDVFLLTNYVKLGINSATVKAAIQDIRLLEYSVLPMT